MIAAAIASLGFGFAAAPPTVIRTEDDLRAHLCSGEPSPLDAMTPTHRRRLVGTGIRFGGRGVSGFNIRTMDALSEADVRAILALLGVEAVVGAVLTPDMVRPQGRAEPHPPLPLTDAYCAGEQSRADWAVGLPMGRLERRLVMLDKGLDAIDPSAHDAYPASARRALYAAAFATPPGPSELREADAQTLERLFATASAAVILDGDEGAARELALAYEALAAREAAPTADLYDHHVARRDFAAARALREQHPDLPPVPSLTGEPTGRAVLSSAPDGHLVPRAVPDDHTGLVVVSIPQCGFSRAADEAITADAALEAAMDRSVWIAPPRTRLRSEAIAAYNEAHPRRPLTFVRRAADWPMVSLWSTPRFYFLKEGEVAHVVDGWPIDEAEENLAALREGFAAIGQPVAQAGGQALD